jgi:hypothetical protein
MCDENSSLRFSGAQANQMPSLLRCCAALLTSLDFGCDAVNEDGMIDIAYLTRVHAELEADIEAEVAEFRARHPKQKALLGIKQAIDALEEAPVLPGIKKASVAAEEPTTVIGIAVRTLEGAGRPLPMKNLFDAVQRIKKFPDERQAKRTVGAMFSKDARITSVLWNDERCWWLAGKPVPAVPLRLQI